MSALLDVYTYHIMTPPKLGCDPTLPKMAANASGVMYPEPAAEGDAGTPTYTLTLLFAEDAAQLCHVA